MATDKKKKPAKPAKKKKGQGNSKIMEFFRNNLKKICFAIALFDLGHALFFVIQATISLILRFSLYSSLALVGTIFWVLIVILFIVGLWKRRPGLVRAWIIFSVVGFVADLGFLIWGIVSSVTIDWDNLSEFTIIFIGIFIESLCIYLVYKYYLIMDPCRLVDSPERGSKKKKKQVKLDKKACKESAKSSKKSSKKSDKKKKRTEKKK